MGKTYLRLLWLIIAMQIIKGGSKNESKQIKHVYARYGDPVILKCLNNTDASAWDGPSLQSSNMYNETPYADKTHIVQHLPNANNFMVVGDIRAGEYNLKIINLTRKEEGYYKCNGHIGITPFEKRFLLKIGAPPIHLSTNAENGTLIGTTGDQMNITCCVRTEFLDNETKIKITMYHDKRIVEESENHIIIHPLVPNKTHNRYIFKCVVDSLLLNVPLKEMIVLDVKYRPSLRFDRTEQNLTVFEGTDLSVTCFTESNPVTTEIFWKRNDQQIKQEVEHVGPHKSVLLHIVNIKQKNRGNYTCVAKNEVGYNTQSIFIRVLCCQVKTEMKNTSVVVSISVITAVCIILGIIMFLTKDKLNKRLRNTSTRCEVPVLVHPKFREPVLSYMQLKETLIGNQRPRTIQDWDFCYQGRQNIYEVNNITDLSTNRTFRFVTCLKAVKLPEGIQDDIAVENQMYQSRDDIAEDGANQQNHSALSGQDYRIETSVGRVYQGRVDTQGNNALNYAEICFPSGSSESRYVVHGRENITIYSDVVLPMSGTPVHSDS